MKNPKNEKRIEVGAFSNKRSLNGVPEGIRTPDPRLRRPLLYPAELQAQNGAGEGNRTLTASLEGWNSTIELHPHLPLCSQRLFYYTEGSGFCQYEFGRRFPANYSHLQPFPRLIAYSYPKIAWCKIHDKIRLTRIGFDVIIALTFIKLFPFEMNLHRIKAKLNIK